MRYAPPVPLIVVSRWLLRAPLLPLEALGRSPRAVFREPDARRALTWAAPSLGDDASRALEGFARRAAFRPTPHGLWAGVAVGELGARTRIATSKTRAHVTVSWARLAALGRALLDEPVARAAARLRVAPSVLDGAAEVRWLAFGPDAGAEARAGAAVLDDALAAVLDAARDWRPFAEVRAALAAVEPAPDDALDDYLLRLVDDGLLAHDLEPPLVGPPPLAWTRARLASAGGAASPSALAAAHAALAGLALDDAEAARATLAALPGASDREPLHAVLVHEPRATPTLSRAAVERAAALAPLLHRLQEALAPPAAERALDAALDDAVDAATEIFGAGALELGALALGEYGTPLDAAPPAAPRAAHQPLCAWLADRLLACAAAGDEELRLDARELDAVVPAAEPPPTFELTLTPAREPRGAAPGTGWLVGLHAPAGATWGRFADALGAPMHEALAELAAAEERARPDERRLDVAFAPTRALADVTAHPPLRRAALALSSWPAGDAVLPRELELCADDAALTPRALRRGAEPVVPSPLERVRSTTAPPGAYRLLAGWTLHRQHAPWALALGPLAELAWLPRVSIDGLVVAPASWRAPELATPAELRRWRRAAGVPRVVQLGREDELLPVDLDAPGALERIAREPGARLFEIWPPLDDAAAVDAGGRRVEAVVAVVAAPDDAAHARAAAAEIAACGRVPPPRRAPPAPGWITFKLFGAADRAERVLAGAVAPAVAAALDAREIDAWFFLRYVDGPGGRDHLRVRVHERAGASRGRFAARLDEALAPARAAADVVAVEICAYHRERARYGEDALDAVERVFQSDSTLASELFAGDDEGDAIEWLVRDQDALAAACGLDPAERRALAARRRAAYVPERDPASALSVEFRARQARLHDRLRTTDPIFDAHRERVSRAVAELPRARREALLPALLHLAAVRLAGIDRAAEIAALYFWERALEGLLKRR
jgi:thiopeptide-type bacteriocin biosynthesis protein